MIHSAGLAIQALTNAKSDNNTTAGTTDETKDADSSLAETEHHNDGSNRNSLPSHKAAFQKSASQYFALLSAIDVRLRRQVYALEEASILVSESSASRASDVIGAGSSTAVNHLDISWLNSRKDTVGKDKEAELWAAAKEFGEKIGKQESSNSKEDHSAAGREMEVDQ